MQLHGFIEKFSGHQVCIGPLVWEQDQISETKNWYFVLAGEHDGKFVIDKINVDGDEPDVTRAEFISSITDNLIRTKRGMVIHTFDDEVELMRMCGVIWPCLKTTKICKDMELEKRSVAGSA